MAGETLPSTGGMRAASNCSPPIDRVAPFGEGEEADLLARVDAIEVIPPADPEFESAVVDAVHPQSRTVAVAWGQGAQAPRLAPS